MDNSWLAKLTQESIAELWTKVEALEAVVQKYHREDYAVALQKARDDRAQAAIRARSKDSDS
jgi:hypothetical protein